MGNGIYFKIAGYVDLDMLHIFELQTCSACQDLSTLQFLAHLYELLPSIGVRRSSVNFFKNLLWNHWANLNQTWPESSLGVSL
jgi:hypothetical protein